MNIMNWFTNRYPYECNHELNLDFILSVFKNLTDAWTEAQTEWKEMRKFIEKFFGELDLTDEVRTIIQGLIDDGTSAGLLASMTPYRVNAVGAGCDNTGETDASVFLNNLIANGGMFYLPSGTYLLEHQLVIPSNVDIKGNGSNTVLIAADSLDLVYHTVCSKNASDINARLCKNFERNGYPSVSILGDYDENIKISDLVIDGNNTGRNTDTWDKFYNHDGYSIQREPGTNIELQKVRHVVLENVISRNGIQHNINVRGGAYSFNEGIDYEALYPSYDVIIRGCRTINELYDDGITTHDSYDIIIEDCFVDVSNNANGTYANAVSNGIEIDDGSRYVTVRNCTTQYAICGFQAKGHDNTPPAHDVIFDGCTARYTQYGFSLACGPSSSYTQANFEHRNNNIKIVNCSIIKPYYFNNVSSWQGSRIFVAMKNSSNVFVDNLYIDANLPTFDEVSNLDIQSNNFRTLFNFREMCENINVSNVRIIGDIEITWNDSALFQITGTTKHVNLTNIFMEGCSGAPIIKYNGGSFYNTFNVINFAAKKLSDEDVFFQWTVDGVTHNNTDIEWSTWRAQGYLDFKYYNVFNGGYVMTTKGGLKEVQLDMTNAPVELTPYGGVVYMLNAGGDINLTDRDYIRIHPIRFVNPTDEAMTINVYLETQPAFRAQKTLNKWQYLEISVDANGGVIWS